MPERRRACSLLGWLALHPGMHPRSEVAGRFWPDVLDSSARKSLRTELVAVRHALGAAGEGVLVATRDTVGLVGDGVCVDAREFERLVREGRLEEAVDLCDGELLPGLDAEWVYEARESHRQPLRRRAGAPGRGRRGGRRAEGRHPHLASPRRARSASGGRPSRAHPAPDRRGGGLRRARGVRRASLAACGRSCTWRPRERPVGCSTPSTRTRGAPASVAAETRPPLPAALQRRERSPFVGREDSLGWLRAQWSDARGGSGRFAVIAGEPGNRQDAAGERARPRRSRGGRGGAPWPLSRGGADLLSAVRRGVRSVRRGGLAGGAAGPSRRRTVASSRGSFPNSRGDCRIFPSRSAATRRASASACSRPPARCSRMRRDRGRSCWCWRTCTGRTSRPPCCWRTWCARSRPSACWSSAPTARRSRRAAGSRCSRTCTASVRSSGCGWGACTAGRSPR